MAVVVFGLKKYKYGNSKKFIWKNYSLQKMAG